MKYAIEASPARYALWAGAASWVLLVASTLATPQGLHFFDPVLPLQALLQWLAGESPHWNILQRVDPTDLSRDVSEWIGWWAPGTSLLMLPGMVAGVQPGHLLRGIAALAILFGTLGWIRWFARFPLPAGWMLILAVSLPWMRYSSANLFRYSAEVLAFGAAPWAFLALAKLPARIVASRITAVALTGLICGFAYWLKFSLLVTVLAAVTALAAGWPALVKPPRVTSRVLCIAAVFLLTLAAAPLAWQLLIRFEGGATPLGGPRGLAWSSNELVFILANPALAAVDAFGPLFFALVHPGVPHIGGKTLLTVAWIGVPGGLLFWLLLMSAWRRERDRAHVVIGACSVFFATIALAFLRILGDVDQTPRHLGPVSLAALPVALAEGRRWWGNQSFRRMRPVLASAGVVYVAGPLLFGPAYVFAKTTGHRAPATLSQSIALWSLSADDSLAEHLTRLYRADPAGILVVPDPELSLLWTGRSIWQFAGSSVGEDLQHSYHGTPPDLRWSTRRPVLLHVLVRTGEQPPPPLQASGFTLTTQPWHGRDYTILSGSIPSAPR